MKRGMLWLWKAYLKDTSAKKTGTKGVTRFTPFCLFLHIPDIKSYNTVIVRLELYYRKAKNMKIKEFGEFGLISLLAQQIPAPSGNVVMGIGDDTAVLRHEPGKLLLMTTDMLVEEVHFSLRYCPFRSVGWKALAVNVSDISAMGGTPSAATVSIGIPPYVDVEQMEQLYQGLGECAGEYGVDVVGGDTVKSPDRLVVNITLLGTVADDRVIYRSGAKPGDFIMVTGSLGNSAAGLYALSADISENSAENAREAVHAHLYPQARVKEGGLLGASGHVTAMNDISDGLASEVLEICRASGTGCELEAAKIPQTASVVELGRRVGVSPRGWALYGGEDFELVFTVTPRELDSVITILEQAGCFPAVIGRITPPEGGCVLIEQKGKSILTPGGYNHFRE